MRFLGWLRTKPELADDAPEVAGFEPRLSGADETAVEFAGDAAADIVSDIFTMIEYVDAKGVRTRRRITFKRFDSGVPTLLEAYCHERRAPRTFYLSRIACFITGDGEVLEPETFWRSIGVLGPIPSFDPPAQRTREDSAAAFLRRELQHQIRLLVGMARADGRQDRAELRVIVAYALAEGERLGRAASDEEIRAFAGYLQRLRPTREALDESLEAMFVMARSQHLDPEAISRFFAAAVEVMEADGDVHITEFNFLVELRDLIARLAGKPTLRDPVAAQSEDRSWDAADPLPQDRLDQFDAYARVMLFAARGDGRLHPAEAEMIISEYEKETAESGQPLPPGATQVLRGRLDGLRSGATTLNASLHALLKDPRTCLDFFARDRLFQSAVNVLNAKGGVHSGEDVAFHQLRVHLRR